MMSLLAVVLILQAAASPGDKGREVVDLLLAGKFQELLALSTPEMKKALTPEVFEKQILPQMTSMGKVESIGEPRVQKMGQYTSVFVPLKFAAAAVDAQVTFNAEGQVAGLFFVPPQEPASSWQHPPYARPDAFKERDITVGAGEWKLPGVLAVPAGQGPFPAVVLVHGSGPNDRDETVLANKPFKDLADGLASRGIAVVRYDKRTKVHGAKMAALKDLTIQQETVEDALLAAALLRAQPEVDPKRVYVLGHSLGAYAAPRIASQDAGLAGLILLAGNTRSLEELTREQFKYLGAPEKADALLKSLPASYMADLRAYDPAAAARKLTLPMLILQGERDYQVTMTDFAGWKKALEGRRNVTFKSYPALNHLFMPGQGKSTPAEYGRPGHVASEVIDDVAKWITGTSARPGS